MNKSAGYLINNLELNAMILSKSNPEQNGNKVINPATEDKESPFDKLSDICTNKIPGDDKDISCNNHF